uniref:Uncharacterized protein n=1 Tax=Caenorhabditis japonica TaxID=281687 RepID=A0A8R1HYQ0_CAEJA
MKNYECDPLDNIPADSREERVMEVDELEETVLLHEPNVSGPAVVNFSFNRSEASSAVESQRAKTVSVATGHQAKARAAGADKGQVSEKETLKISAVISHIRTQSRASEAQVALMISPLTQELLNKEKTLEAKNSEIDELQTALEIMRNKNYDLQTAVSLMDKRHAALEEVCQLAHLADTIEPTSHEHAANLGEIRFEQ